MTREKLNSLGVACQPATDATKPSEGSCSLPRRAFAVYENNGAAWRAFAARVASRRDALTGSGQVGTYYQNLISYGSRFVSVDASTDAAALRRAYPDRRRHVILPVVVRAWVTLEGPSKKPLVSSAIQPVTTTLIVPAGLSDRVSSLATTYAGDREPRYMITVAIGRHHEPWILAIDPIDTGPAPH